MDRVDSATYRVNDATLGEIVMNSYCDYCDVEDKCDYLYKPCDCCNYRKFTPKPEPVNETKVIQFPKEVASTDGLGGWLKRRKTWHN